MSEAIIRLGVEFDELTAEEKASLLEKVSGSKEINSGPGAMITHIDAASEKVESVRDMDYEQ